jgi:hypothetical protein
MNDRDARLAAARKTRLKNLTAKKAERGSLEPNEEKEFQRLTASSTVYKTAKIAAA